MNPTDSQIAFCLRKLKTALTRMDVDKDGYISKEDFELMAERMNKLGNATAEQAASCHQSLMQVANFFGYKHGEKLPREQAAEDMHEVMFKISFEEQRALCANFPTGMGTFLLKNTKSTRRRSLQSSVTRTK